MVQSECMVQLECVVRAVSEHGALRECMVQLECGPGSQNERQSIKANLEVQFSLTFGGVT